MKSFNETLLYRELKNRKSDDAAYFIEKINTLVYYCEIILQTIRDTFSNYTEHGLHHSINVVDYMASFIDNLSKLNELEITIMIYSALLHDIGMVTNEEYKKKIRSEEIILGSRKYSRVYAKYNDDNIAIQECIRPVHGRRVKEVIEEIILVRDNSLFDLPNSSKNFLDILFRICRSHNEDFSWIDNELQSEWEIGNYGFNPQFIAIILRLSDLIDFDDKRAPTILMNFISIGKYSELEWNKHQIIENYDKVKINSTTGLKYIVFYGETSDSRVYRHILKYIDYLQSQLHESTKLCLRNKWSKDKYSFNITEIVDNKIATRGFSLADFQLSLDYSAVTSLLMGENIYGDKKYGLRELVQNSIDACNVVLKQNNDRVLYKPFISISWDEDRGILSIFDTGTGMNLDILKNYFLNVGVSYYKSDDFNFKGFDYDPIGNYGIGFLACFMLSDHVSIRTKQSNDTQGIRVELKKDSEYIDISFEENSWHQGTEISLDLHQFKNVFSTPKDVSEFIKSNFLSTDIEINFFVSNAGNSCAEGIELMNLKQLSDKYVDLSKYMNNIDLLVEMDCSNISFLQNLGDINNNQETYILTINNDNFELQKADNRQIDEKFIRAQDEIIYLDFPRIADDDAEKMIIGLEVTDDYESALDRVDYSRIQIILDYSCQRIKADGVVEDDESIISDIDLDIDFLLEELKDSLQITNDAPIRFSGENIRVLYKKNNLLLEFVDGLHEKHQKYRFYSKYFRNKLTVYSKNILISNVSFEFKEFIEGVHIKNIFVNNRNKNIIPNVSRNDFNKGVKDDLSYSIAKAILLHIIDETTNRERKELVSCFLEKFYNKDSDYNLLK